MEKKVIELQNIRRDFRVGDETVHALRGVSFTITEGEFVTIMGTSGSGKSTLLNTLGCLDTPTSGEYLLDGIAVRTMSKPARAVLRNRKIGFVFQNYNLLPKTTAVENVELPLMYIGATAARHRGVAIGRARRPAEPQVESNVGRADAARGDSPRVGEQSRCNPRRRGDGKSRYANIVRNTCPLSGTAPERAHHHLRNAQSRTVAIQQPHHTPARRAGNRRQHKPEYSVGRKSLSRPAEKR